MRSMLETVILCYCLLSAHASTASTAITELQLLARVDHLDTLAREPMVVRHLTGALFVSGYGSQVSATDWTAPPPLWRSDDDGASWQRVDVGSSAEGAQGNSDVDLTVGPDGTLYLLAMGFNRATREGTHVAVGVSHDIGSTWSWHRLSTTRRDDRPWIAIADSGIAHVVWNDGAGVRHSIGTDAGRRWTEQARIHGKGGSSHLAVGPDGLVAVRISPLSASGNQFDPDTDLVAVSRDDGKSWTLRPAPGAIEWDPTLSDPAQVARWVEPLAWDLDGMLYHLWSEGAAVVLAWSKDFGENWSRQIVATEEGIAFFPYLVAHGRELAATWFVRSGGELSVRLVLIEPVETVGELKTRRADPFIALAWKEAEGERVPTSAGEYVPVIFLPGGDLAVVSPIQDARNDRWGFTWWRFRRGSTE